jgi:polyphosphate glucokinase
MKILVIDIGGTNVKVKHSDHEEIRKHPSGPELTPEILLQDVTALTSDWEIEAISVGYPGPVHQGKILREPFNLGRGWVDCDMSALFGKPVRLINDAAMQALGSYDGGRMLFLGLGTGLGNALIIDGTIAAMELGHLPYKKKKSFEGYLGNAGRLRLGNKKWRKAVADVVSRLKHACIADYVVLGGGNAKKIAELPPGSRLGDNANAFTGGVRLWDSES